MIEIARDDVLGPELAMRGGTCLHKLHLPTPLRYSEDLDYVRKTRRVPRMSHEAAVRALLVLKAAPVQKGREARLR